MNALSDGIRPDSDAGDAAAVSDGELMRRARGDDETAFAALMNRWELPIKAVIARLVLNASEAAELAEETFVRVWQRRHQFREQAEFRPWLFAIAVNLARNRLRWWRVRPHIALEAWTEKAGAEGTTALAEIAPSQPDDPRESALRWERADAIREAIAALPAELREALVLFEYEGLSHAEIAEVVGSTPKATETRIYRAREKLRSALRAWV